MRLIFAACLCLIAAMAQGAERLDSSAGPLRLEPMATGLSQPWSLGFLPDGAVLITERGGRLLLLRPGAAAPAPVAGAPKVWERGQGGLFDVLVPRDFARNRELFLSYAKAQPDGAGTAVARARLSADGTRLEGLREIYAIAPGSSGGRHFGGRLIEARDGTLILSVGDRGDRPSAQDRSRPQGALLRITKTGAPAPGNPYLGQAGIAPEIWSYGHRNPQGMALDRQGQLWIHEHGAKGGDEVNLIRKGANYGWPVISYGTHYSGAKIGEGRAKPGMEQPEFYWDPSIAPSGLVIYSGKLWPQWRGHFFVGSLKFDYIARLAGAPLAEREALKGPQTGRVRDLREAPDGSLWFLSVEEGAAFRITPG